tara:strand:+ start:2214 stop:3254 length:1041 start_codon:yes stop_codon:yes gene_type:complete
MTDAIQAGRGLVDYPGLYPNATGTVVANISGVTAIPGPITLAALAAAMGSTSYQGTWNASTNTPTLASSAGTNGYYYVVSVAGTTSLDHISDWSVGDWAIYNGNVSAWQKVEGGATTMTVGTTTVTGGTSGRVLYDNAGVLGEMTNTGTGTVNVLQTSPALITPALGIATGTSLALGGASGATLAVTGTAAISGTTTMAAFNAVGTSSVIGTTVVAGAASGNATATFRVFGGLSNSAGFQVTQNSATDASLILNTVAGGTLGIGANNAAVLTFAATTNAVSISTSLTLAGALTVPGVTTAALTSTGTFTSGAGAQVGTLTNAPAAGNPTTWIKIIDNGTTRYIPAW